MRDEMTKTVIRYFFDFLDGQEKWLNKMAAQGWRLNKCGLIYYTFEQCEPDEYEYKVEFVADQSYQKSQQYKAYLENMGYWTAYKNINVGILIGNSKWRPWAKGMGQITSSPGSFHKELLLIGKKKDGKAFELHTDIYDLWSIYRTVRNSYLWTMLGIVGVGYASIILGDTTLPVYLLNIIRAVTLFVGITWAIPTIKYCKIYNRLKLEKNTYQ